MAKEYELNVEEILELESTHVIGYKTKGHHNRFDFSQAVFDKMDESKQEKYSLEYIKKNSYHKWAKSVPWCGGGTFLVLSDEERKGWYPITVFDM